MNARRKRASIVPVNMSRHQIPVVVPPVHYWLPTLMTLQRRGLLFLTEGPLQTGACKPNGSQAPFSLYFGIPGQWTYATDPASNGAAISPEFAVPVTADTVMLTFATWVDIASLACK